MTTTPIRVKFYDLMSAAAAQKLMDVVARDEELSRLERILLRPRGHHALIIGEPGGGKTTLVEALIRRIHGGVITRLPRRAYRLHTDVIHRLITNGDSLTACMEALQQAVQQLETALIVIEDLQLLIANDPARVELALQFLAALSARPGIRLVVSVTSTSYHRSLEHDYLVSRLFSPLELSPPSQPSLHLMVQHHLPRIQSLHGQRITEQATHCAITLSSRFKHNRSQPDATLRLLEEVAVKASLEGRSVVTRQDVFSAVSEREHTPFGELTAGDHDHLAQLQSRLSQAVIGQSAAINALAANVARAQLGLVDATKPRGSFLLLGPSGVGKTETAKALARLVYRSERALVRLDMSEYSEAHAAVRLIGAPPGYVGYEEGGQLTGAVAREPYSLVLLDEIEKAHPQLFDLFLQLLDDGRLTDSSGRVVDFTQTMVLATSNCASADIAAAATAGHDVHSPAYLQEVLIPILLRHFRPEFINRFDAVLVYQPLSESHLLALAQRELARLEDRLSSHGIHFDIPAERLLGLLRPMLNPLFGARPVKRLITQHFETPLAHQLIHRALPTPITIKGDEPWLSLT